MRPDEGDFARVFAHFGADSSEMHAHFVSFFSERGPGRKDSVGALESGRARQAEDAVRRRLSMAAGAQ